MAKRKIGLICAAILFMGLVLVQVFVGGSSAANRQTVLLPSGRMLTLEKVDYGKVLESGNPLLNRLGNWLPKWANDKLGLKPRHKLHDGDPAVGVWMTFHGPAKEWPSNTKVKIGLDGGESGSLESHARRTEVGPEETRVEVAFPVFPRRAGKLRVTIHQSDKSWNEFTAAEFVFASPVTETFPVWTPESMPAVRKTNDLEVRLTRLAFGVSSQRNFTPARADERSRAEAAFEILEHGKSTDKWIPDGVKMSDATGNERSQGSWGGKWRKGSYNFSWSPALWRDKGGMKFKFEMTRTPKGGFTTNELIVLKDVPVPQGTNVTRLDLVTNRLGHAVRIIGLAGANGKIQTSPHRFRSASSDPELFLEVTPPLLDKQLDLISVIDDQRRDGKSSGASWSRPSGTYELSLDYHNEAKTVDITLAVHRSFYVEFVVEPEILKPVPKSPK